MKVTKSELKVMIAEMVVKALSEQDNTPPTRAANKNRFKQRPVDRNTLDPNTPDGRDNLVDIVSPSFGSVMTRLQILDKLAAKAMAAETRQQFKEHLIEMFDNLKSLQEKDMRNLVAAYSKISSTLGLKPSSNIGEQNLNPDTPDGRRNLMKDLFNIVRQMKISGNEGQKMLANARHVPTIAVFVNEIKAFAGIVSQLNKALVMVNSEFVKTFQAYESQRGRTPSTPPAPPAQTPGQTPGQAPARATPPPVPPAKKT